MSTTILRWVACLAIMGAAFGGRLGAQDEKARENPEKPRASGANEEIILESAKGKIDGAVYVEDVDCITCWQSCNARVTWSFQATASGKYAAIVNLVLGNGPSKYAVTVGDQKVTGAIAGKGNPGWSDYVDDVLGVVELKQGAAYKVTLQVTSMPNGLPMNFRRITLQPLTAELEKEIEKAKQRVAALDSGEIILGSTDGKIQGALRFYDSFVGGWTKPEDAVKWSFVAPKSGKYTVVVTCTHGNGPSEYAVTVGDQRTTGKIAQTSGTEIIDDVLGEVDLVQGKTYEAVIKATSMPNGSPLSFRRITLQPAEAETPKPATPGQKEILLRSADGKIDGTYLTYLADLDCIACWQNRRARVTWSFTAPASGKFAVVVTSVHGNGPSKYVVAVGDQKATGVILGEGDPNWSDFVDDIVGSVELVEGKTYKAALQVTSMPNGAPMNFRSIALQPLTPEHEPEIEKARQRVAALESGDIVLGSGEGEILGALKLTDSGIGGWTKPEDAVKWSFVAPQSGLYRVIVACTHENAPGEYAVTVGEKKVTGKVAETNAEMVEDVLGELELVQSKTYEAVIKATSMPNGSPMSLRRIILRPSK